MAVDSAGGRQHSGQGGQEMCVLARSNMPEVRLPVFRAYGQARSALLAVHATVPVLKFGAYTVFISAAGRVIEMEVIVAVTDDDTGDHFACAMVTPQVSRLIAQAQQRSGGLATGLSMTQGLGETPDAQEGGDA